MPRQKSLKQRFINYILPSTISLWVFSIYSIVDGFFVARFAGVAEFSSVSLVIPFVNVLFALAILFSIGAQTLIGIDLGQGKLAEARQLFTFIMRFVTGFALAIMLLGFLFMKPLLFVLGAQGEFFELSQAYLRIILLFSPFFIISYSFEVLVKIDGFPRVAVIGATTSCLTNVLLDYIFIAHCHWSVTGAALATGLAQFLSTFIYILHFQRKIGPLSFVKTNISWRKATRHLAEMIYIGLGEFISEFNAASILFIFNTFILRYLGEAYIAPYAVMNYIALFVSCTYQGVCHGTAPLLSYYYGRKDQSAQQQLRRYGFVTIFGLSLLAYGFTFFGGHTILSLFLKEARQVEAATPMLRHYALTFLLSGYNVFIAAIASAVKRPIYGILINLGRGSVFLLLALWLILSFLGQRAFFYAAPLAELLTFALAAYTFYQLQKNKRQTL